MNINISINKDRPIKSRKDDLLNRVEIAKELAEEIYSQEAKAGLVLGIFGKWGIGKTSLMNMIKEEFEEIDKRAKEPKKPIVMNFNPWIYKDEMELIGLFLRDLRRSLNSYSLSNWKKFFQYILTVLSLYRYIATMCAWLVLDYYNIGLLDGLLKRIMSCFPTPTMEQAKINLEKRLEKLNPKIIVVIDDLDRANKKQIRDTIQMIKHLGDLPNVTYILLADWNQICKALAEDDLDGYKYIEKFIDKQINLVEVDGLLIRNLVYERLINFLDANKLGKFEDVVEKDYWDGLYYFCVSNYIKTIRDVKRVENIFYSTYIKLQKEVRFEDLFILSTLNALEPNFYKWISDNPDFLCWTYDNEWPLLNVDVNEYKKKYLDELQSLNINMHRAMKVLELLFPAFAKEMDIHDFESCYGIMHVPLENRISDRLVFHKYFPFAIK